MTYSSIKLRQDQSVSFITLDRPAANNTINAQLIEELESVLAECERSSNVVFIEGTPDVFCLGLDFTEVPQEAGEPAGANQAPARLYEIWRRLSSGPFISVAHVRGKATAGGVGFVAACDLVLAGPTAAFSLSELLFGLIPACVLPFLIRRVGWQRARYMTLTARTVGAEEAAGWGLVDCVSENSTALLASYLPRLRRLQKHSIREAKSYLDALSDFIPKSKGVAVETNLRMFADPVNHSGIVEFIRTGRFPWEVH